MPTNKSTVGGLTLPVPEGTLNTALEDPTVLGLLDFLAHWLKYGLDEKLANMQGTSATAIPVNATYPYDPDSIFVRTVQQLPALYVWPHDEYTRPHTILKNRRERTIKAAYIFNELVAPSGLRARHGLMGAVGAVFVRAARWGRHRTYGYDTDPDGTPIARSVGIMDWRHRYTQYGMMWRVPGTTEGVPERVGTGGDGSIQRGYPTVKAEFIVNELINNDSLIDLPEYPNDVMPDATLSIETGDTTQDTVEIMQRVLPAEDGDDD